MNKMNKKFLSYLKKKKKSILIWNSDDKKIELKRTKIINIF